MVGGGAGGEGWWGGNCDGVKGLGCARTRECALLPPLKKLDSRFKASLFLSVWCVRQVSGGTPGFGCGI
jgi:hypothetical protein